jgi:hypothetical protein
VPGGDALAETETASRAEVEDVLKRPQRFDADRAAFDQLTRRLVAVVSAHLTAEETEVFTRLAAVCPPEVLEALGDQVRNADASR